MDIGSLERQCGYQSDDGPDGQRDEKHKEEGRHSV
jgi:hypothetical protein